MIEIVPYSADKQSEWDSFVERSFNATFLFYRNYMDYHSDRFTDCSLMVYRDGKLISLIPANRDGDTFHSHGGLSYGGFVIGDRVGAKLMLDIFELWLTKLKQDGFDSIIYKPVPVYFHRSPCEFDIYAMFRHNFEISRREISTMVKIEGAKIKSNRKNGYNLAKKSGLTFELSEDFDTFVDIANERLEEKYDTKCVHTADELRLLHSRFPDNLKLHGAFLDGKMLGGSVLYLINNTLHAQYLYTNEEGRNLRTLDFMIVSILRDLYPTYDYFDFGKSTEEGGQYLNEQLIKTKEEFGGTSICYDTYRLNL